MREDVTHLLDVLVEQEDTIVESVLVDALAVQRKRPRTLHHADFVKDDAATPSTLDGVAERDAKVRCEELGDLGGVTQGGGDEVVGVGVREARVGEGQTDDGEEEVGRGVFDRCRVDWLDREDVREEGNELRAAGSGGLGKLVEGASA